jgi:hypothetical protein
MADIETRIYIIVFISPGIPAQTVKVLISAIYREILLTIDFAPLRYLITLNYSSPY